MKRNLLLTLLACCVLLLAGCKRGDDAPEPGANRTILIYMAANNNLGSPWYKHDTQNLEMLTRGVAALHIAPARILIYHAPYGGEGNALKEVVRTGDGQAEIRTLKNYPKQNSVATETMREVLDDVSRLAPNLSYGLILWSHASGWLPAPVNGRQLRSLRVGEPLTRVFGQDDNQPLPERYMTYSDLVATLPDHMFDFIICDVCYMGGAEEAYGLRNKAGYMIASPAEVLGQGMPYDQIVGDLTAPSARLTEICRKFYDYYNAMSGQMRSATTALYDLRQMDALAGVMRQVVSGYGSELTALDPYSLQRFDRETDPRTRFDFAQAAGKVMADGDPLLSALRRQLDLTVLYKAATPMMMDAFSIDTYCGMSVYIPFSSSRYSALNTEYEKTDWYKAVYTREQ